MHIHAAIAAIEFEAEACSAGGKVKFRRQFACRRSLQASTEFTPDAIARLHHPGV